MGGSVCVNVPIHVGAKLVQPTGTACLSYVYEDVPLSPTEIRARKDRAW